MNFIEFIIKNRILNKCKSKSENFIFLIVRNFDLLVNLFLVLSIFLITISFFGFNLNSLFILFPSVFLIYFIPGYQLFFRIFEHKYNFIEKIALTIIFSMIFNILIGIIGGYLGILISGLFYMICILIAFYFLMFLNKCIRKTALIKQNDVMHIGNLIPKNFLLFIVFLVLFAFFSISRYPLLFGTDPWFHLILTNEIIETGKIPFESYRGLNGLHLMGAVIHFFSGYPTIEIVRYFPIINYIISGLIGLIVFKKIFKNNQIGILSSLLLLVAPYHYDEAQSQYSPTALCLSIFLFMMFFYIERIKNFKFEIKQSVISYIFIGIGFFALIFISDISAILFLGLFIFISFFFTILDKKKFIDLGFFTFLFLIYVVYNIIGFQTIIVESFLVDLSLPIYLFPILGVIGISLIILISKYSSEPKGKFKSWLNVEPNASILKKVSLIYLKPILIILIIILPIIISILITISFTISYDFVYIFTYIVIPITVIVASMILSVFGVIIYRKKHLDGTLIYLWTYYSVLILAVYFIYDLLFIKYMLWIRMITYSSIGLICAEMAYLFYLYQDKFFKPKTYKKFYLIVFNLTLISSLLATSNVTQFKKSYEISSAQWFGRHLSKESSFLTGFRWNYILDYYSGENQSIYFNEAFLLFPSNQINETGFNNLRQFQQELNEIDLFLLLDDKQIMEGIFGDVIGINLGKLNSTILKEYYNLPYLNRIFTSKNAMNQSVQVYWVNGN